VCVCVLLEQFSHKYPYCAIINEWHFLFKHFLPYLLPPPLPSSYLSHCLIYYPLFWTYHLSFSLSSTFLLLKFHLSFCSFIPSFSTLLALCTNSAGQSCLVTIQVRQYDNCPELKYGGSGTVNICVDYLILRSP